MRRAHLDPLCVCTRWTPAARCAYPAVAAYSTGVQVPAATVPHKGCRAGYAQKRSCYDVICPFPRGARLARHGERWRYIVNKSRNTQKARPHNDQAARHESVSRCDAEHALERCFIFRQTLSNSSLRPASQPVPARLRLQSLLIMRAPVETWLPSWVSTSKIPLPPSPAPRVNDYVVEVGPAPGRAPEDEEDEILSRHTRSHRGSRDEHVKVTRLSSEPHAVLPGLQRRASPDRASHHLLPVGADACIPDIPILYLPPLLSPLPTTLAKARRRIGPTAEELDNFQTRLPDIDPASLDLHEALHHFKPVDGNYAARPYDEAFNWDDLVSPSPHLSARLIGLASVSTDVARVVLRRLPLPAQCHVVFAVPIPGRPGSTRGGGEERRPGHVLVRRAGRDGAQPGDVCLAEVSSFPGEKAMSLGDQSATRHKSHQRSEAHDGHAAGQGRVRGLRLGAVGAAQGGGHGRGVSRAVRGRRRGLVES